MKRLIFIFLLIPVIAFSQWNYNADTVLLFPRTGDWIKAPKLTTAPFLPSGDTLSTNLYARNQVVGLQDSLNARIRYLDSNGVYGWYRRGYLDAWINSKLGKGDSTLFTTPYDTLLTHNWMVMQLSGKQNTIDGLNNGSKLDTIELFNNAWTHTGEFDNHGNLLNYGNVGFYTPYGNRYFYIDSANGLNYKSAFSIYPTGGLTITENIHDGIDVSSTGGYGANISSGGAAAICGNQTGGVYPRYGLSSMENTYTQDTTNSNWTNSRTGWQQNGVRMYLMSDTTKVAGRTIKTMAAADSLEILARTGVLADSNTTKHYITLTYAINHYQPIISLIDTTKWNTAYNWGNWSHTTISGYGITDAMAKGDSSATPNGAKYLTATEGNSNYSPLAGSSSIVTTGTLTSGGIGSGFTSIDTSYTNAVSKIVCNNPLSTVTSGKARFLSVDTSSKSYGLATLNNVARTYSLLAGSSSIVTTGTLTSGGIGSGFTAIDHSYLTGIVQADISDLTNTSSPTFASATFNRATTSNYGLTQYKTATRSTWQVGVRNDATEKYQWYYTTGVTPAILDTVGNFTILGKMTATNYAMTINRASTTDFGIYSHQTATRSTWQVGVRNDAAEKYKWYYTTGVIGLTLDTVGNLTIGNLAANGGAPVYESSGTLGLNTSDRRLKTNIVTLTGNLAKVLSLTPVSYNMMASALSAPTHNGFIAQDVLPIIPDAVFSYQNNGDTTTYYGIDGSKFAPQFAGAIQELYALHGTDTTRAIAREGLKLNTSAVKSGAYWDTTVVTRGTVKIPAGDSIQVPISGITASSIVILSKYGNKAKIDTLSWIIPVTGKITIYSNYNSTVAYQAWR